MALSTTDKKSTLDNIEALNKLFKQVDDQPKRQVYRREQIHLHEDGDTVTTQTAQSLVMLNNRQVEFAVQQLEFAKLKYRELYEFTTDLYEKTKELKAEVRICRDTIKKITASQKAGLQDLLTARVELDLQVDDIEDKMERFSKTVGSAEGGFMVVPRKSFGNRLTASKLFRMMVQQYKKIVGKNAIPPAEFYPGEAGYIPYDHVEDGYLTFATGEGCGEPLSKKRVRIEAIYGQRGADQLRSELTDVPNW